MSAELTSYSQRTAPDNVSFTAQNEVAQLLLAHANGARGYVQASMIAHTASDAMYIEIEVYGSAGSIQLRFTFYGPDAGITGSLMTDAHAHRQPLVTPTSYFGSIDHFDIMHLFLHEQTGINDFVNAVQQQRMCTPSFDEGLAVQRVLDAARQAAETGCRVPIA